MTNRNEKVGSCRFESTFSYCTQGSKWKVKKCPVEKNWQTKAKIRSFKVNNFELQSYFQHQTLNVHAVRATSTKFGMHADNTNCSTLNEAWTNICVRTRTILYIYFMCLMCNKIINSRTITGQNNKKCNSQHTLLLLSFVTILRNAICVATNKQLARFQTRCGVLFRLCQEKGQKTFLFSFQTFSRAT